jgi:hypothetical protein
MKEESHVDRASENKWLFDKHNGARREEMQVRNVY